MQPSFNANDYDHQLHACNLSFYDTRFAVYLLFTTHMSFIVLLFNFEICFIRRYQPKSQRMNMKKKIELNWIEVKTFEKKYLFLSPLRIMYGDGSSSHSFASCAQTIWVFDSQRNCFLFSFFLNANRVIVREKKSLDIPLRHNGLWLKRGSNMFIADAERSMTTRNRPTKYWAEYIGEKSNALFSAEYWLQSNWESRYQQELTAYIAVSQWET